MIIDKLENCGLYYGVHKNMEKAFTFIKKALAEDMPVGKYEIDGEELFCIVQEYETKEEATVKYEGHRKYIDIQYIAKGEECMEIVDIENTVSVIPYNEEKDAEFFEAKGKTWKNVVPVGTYGIFMPNDIHRPGMRVDGIPAPLKKILIKIKI